MATTAGRDVEDSAVSRRARHHHVCPSRELPHRWGHRRTVDRNGDGPRHNAVRSALAPGQTRQIPLGRTLSRTGWYAAQPRLVLPGTNASCARPIQLTTRPRGGGLVYIARLPLADLGADVDTLCGKAIGFNLIVNDEDGGKREGFAFVAPGLGRGTDTQSWPLVSFQDPRRRREGR